MSSSGSRTVRGCYALLAVVAAVMVCRSHGQALSHAPGQASFMDRMEQIMSDMDRGMMAAPMTGDADHDFAAMMIPHHQGAIDMAKAELLYGKDPQMRRIAQEILVDQQSEIDLMNRWLKSKAEKK